MIVFSRESDYKYMNDMFYFLFIFEYFTFTYLLTFVNISFRIAIEYLQRLKNRMCKHQHLPSKNSLQLMFYCFLIRYKIKLFVFVFVFLYPWENWNQKCKMA